MTNLQAVDVAFTLQGTTIPVDHGYLLYAALSRLLPQLHGDERAGIHPIRGALAGQRMLELTAKSRLTLRIPDDAIGPAIGLVGRQVTMAGHTVDIGVPTIYPLRPVAALASRLVVIRGFMEPEGFLAAANRQLEALDIHATPVLVARSGDRATEGRSASAAGSPLRRTLRIHDKEVVGFAMLVDHLTAEESIWLQEVGLGGRRRFGCGVFVPARR